LVNGRYSISKKLLPMIIALTWALACFITISAIKGLGTGGIIRFTIVTLIVLLVTVGEPLIERWIPGPTVDLGNASYSLYLFHPLIAPVIPTALAAVGLRSGALSVVLSVIVAVACALVIYRFVEKPVTERLKARLPYGQARKEIPAKAVPA
jgi:exopolysaccharide production protein ExoZ